MVDKIDKTEGLKKIKEKLRSFGIEPIKGLGQNFLFNEEIAEKIVDHASISPGDTVLEIGPGLGILSERIAERAGRTILIEKDERLAKLLDEMFEESEEHTQRNLEIIQGDALEVDFPPFDKVLSNLPFQISSPLTFKILDHDLKNAVLTYQKEFAERMTAEPGESGYSRLSVMVSTHARVKRLFDVSRNDFYPPPEVDATVVELIPREPDFDLENPKAFSRVVKELFKYRRKMIRSSLKTARESGKLDFQEIENSEEIPYERKRVGNLTPEQICEIAEFLIQKRGLEP